MKNFSISSKLKLWIILTLVVAVVGMALFGILHLNGAVDFRKSYEVKVTVDQNYDGAADFAKTYTEEYFESKGISDVSYGVQSVTDGYLFKLNKIEGFNAADATAYVNNKLDAKYGAGVREATFSVKEVKSAVYSGAGYVAIALAIAVVAAFVYLLIIEKLASALSVVLSALLSGILFLSLMAITRVPAYPFVSFTFMAAVAVSLVLSTVIVHRYKEEMRLDEKATPVDIANKVASLGLFRTVFFACALLLVALLLIIVGPAYLRFLGLQLVLVTVCGVYASFIGTPIIWAFFKGLNKKKKAN